MDVPHPKSPSRRKKGISLGVRRSSNSVLQVALCVLGVFVAGVLYSLSSFPEHTPHIDAGLLPRLSGSRVGPRQFRLNSEAEPPRRGDELAGRDRHFGGGIESLSGFTSGARWPALVGAKTEEFEEISHPGDGSITMFVPRFWSEPVHNDTLMSKDLAMSIGSCSTPDQTGNFVRGNDCSEDERTIFVSLASYRDYHCRITLESVFLRATHPERIRVAVVEQVKGDDQPCTVPVAPCNRDPKQVLCRYRDQIDLYTMDAELAVGPVFARHISHRFYRGEFYVMQIDAQVIFTADWDQDIIRQHLRTRDEMAVLSSSLTDINGAIDEATGVSLNRTRPVECETHYFGEDDTLHLNRGTQPLVAPTIPGMPELQPFWAAPFSFARGHFVVNVPYDLYQPLIFSGEEISITIRGFTIGYDFFSLGGNVCFHVFAKGPNKKKRKEVPQFWENEDKYKDVDKELAENSMKRLIGIIEMTNLNPHAWNHVGAEKYGIGKARPTSKFFETFGIYARTNHHEHNLCEFVKGGDMHNMFIKNLRADRMGIDYDKINYRFKNPLEGTK